MYIVNCHIKVSLQSFYEYIEGFRESKKNVWSNSFWNVEVCIFWKWILAEKQIFKNFHSVKIVQKMPFLSFHKLQFVTVFPLISDSNMSWSTRFVSLKLCVEFPIFDFCFRSLYFYSTKWMDSLTLKRQNFFQN